MKGSSGNRFMRTHLLIFSVGLVTLAFVQPQEVCADVVRLKNAGEVRGILEGNSTDADLPVTIRTLSGTLVEIDRDAIEFVQRRSQVVEEYVSRMRSLEPSVESHWELAQWCRSRLLKDQRFEQLEMLLEIDPDHEEARRILGHVKHNGQWMTREQMMEERGYVRHKNKWITVQELALIEKNAEQREAELVWYPQIRVWLGWVTGRDEYRRGEGLREFHAIDDPDAIPALAKSMATHEQLAVRQLYVEILGNIDSPLAVEALLDRYLFDSSQAVWMTAFQSISESQQQTAVPMLISALTNGSNGVVRRAATALGEIGQEEAVPALIRALVTTHKYKVQVTESQPISFGATANGGVGMVDPRVAMGTTSFQLEALARLGQLPYGAQVIPFNQTPKNVRTVTVTVDVKNEEVLAALEKITVKNFGFNERDWDLWWSVYKS